MKLAVGLDQNFNLGPLDLKSRALALLSFLPACFVINGNINIGDSLYTMCQRDM